MTSVGDSPTRVCSLARELEQLEHAAEAAMVLTNLVGARGAAGDDEANRLPVLSSALVSLLGARLRDLRLVVRGQRDPGEFWSPACDTSPTPITADDADVRFQEWSDGERTERACAEVARLKTGTPRKRGAFHPRRRRTA